MANRGAARAIVLRHGWNATAYQVLNPGMRHWFSDAGDAVAGYDRYRRTRVVAGAPVCEPARLESVAGELERDTTAHDERLLYFGAGSRLERVYARHGDRCRVLLGAQPVWDPAEWTAIVARKASLRAQLHRAANKGVHVRELAVDDVRRALPRLQRVLRDWLDTRGLPPLGFMVEPDLLDAVEDRRVFCAERGSERELVAFLVASPVPARNGWLVEQWPRARHAPNGTIHLLIDAAMRAFAAGGSRFATLGLAPLSERAGDVERDQPRWLRLVLRWVRAHGRRFYNFGGLERFKASLQPREWEAVYAIGPGPRFTPGMLAAVAGVFCRGRPVRYVAGALGKAAWQEARRLVPGRGAHQDENPPSPK